MMFIAPLCKTERAIELCEYAFETVLSSINQDYEICVYDSFQEFYKDFLSDPKFFSDIDYVIFTGINNKMEINILFTTLRAMVVEINHIKYIQTPVGFIPNPQVDSNIVGDIDSWKGHNRRYPHSLAFIDSDDDNFTKASMLAQVDKLFKTYPQWLVTPLKNQNFRILKLQTNPFAIYGDLN